MRTKHVFLMLSIFLLSTACAKQKFSPMQKAAVVGEGVLNDGTDTGSEPGGEYPLNEGEVPSVEFLCSNNETAQTGYNLKSAQKLEIQIIDEAGKVICKNDASNIKESIINNRRIPVKVCAEAKGLSYRVRLLDSTATEKNQIQLKKGLAHKFTDLINFNGQMPVIKRSDVKKPFVFKSGDSEIRTGDVVVLLDENNGSSGSDPLCDKRASPLIVKTVQEDHKGIELTSQRDGIDFDILGENSDPHAHAKKRISWITKSSYMFLVKPNVSGKVNGINEMFGDNTKGPDGEFAKDGYHALSKYDLNKDNVIDASDAVYKDLKLWSDKNLDGKSQRGELISLADAGLEAIDLEFDASFSETDKHGNQTKMKSVVRYSDGSYRLIFDLWFNYVGKNRRY